MKKILVPVDGSETSWRALAEARELAEAFNGELLVINVIQPYNNSAMLVVPLDQATINQGNNELTKIGNGVLDTAREKLKDFKGKKDFDLEVGHPSERVLAVCKEKEMHCHRHRQPGPERHCGILPGQCQQQGVPIRRCSCTDCKITGNGFLEVRRKAYDQ